MISIFGGVGIIFGTSAAGAFLAAPGALSLMLMSPVPYPTAGMALMLAPLNALSQKDDR